jgi:hypothetical protein
MKHQPLLLAWLPIAITIVGLGGLTYAAVQHSLRLGANDPQIQLAEDAAAKLASGAAPSGVVPGPTVDAHASLATFMIVFDSTGQVVASSGQINSHTPMPPAGLLDYTKAHGQDRFTWQPQSDVRLAAVTRYYQGPSGAGYILAARSLREVESRESQLTLMTAAAISLLLIVTLAATALSRRF